MSTIAAPDRPMRIGDLAKAVGTTTRTVRYYEEIGLLPRSEERPAGQHRVYTEAHLERLRELIRLRDLLGVSLEELRELVEAEDARAALRTEFHASVDPERRREILEEALPLIRSEGPPDRVARAWAGRRHAARGGTDPSRRYCMACLLGVIAFVV